MKKSLFRSHVSHYVNYNAPEVFDTQRTILCDIGKQGAWLDFEVSLELVSRYAAEDIELLSKVLLWDTRWTANDHLRLHPRRFFALYKKILRSDDWLSRFTKWCHLVFEPLCVMMGDARDKIDKVFLHFAPDSELYCDVVQRLGTISGEASSVHRPYYVIERETFLTLLTTLSTEPALMGTAAYWKDVCGRRMDRNHVTALNARPSW